MKRLLKIGKWTVPLIVVGALVSSYPSQTHAVANTTQIFMGRVTGSGTPNASRWLLLNSSSAPLSSTAASTSPGIMPIAGTFSNLRAYVEGAPGVGQSWTVTIDIGGTLKTVTCQIADTNTSCSDLVHSDAILASQVVSIKFAASAAPAATQMHFSIQFTPTTAGQTAWFYSGLNPLSATAEQYNQLSSDANSNTTGETTNTVILPEGGTFQNLYHALGGSASPGTYSFAPRNLSANATSSFSCVISATQCQDTSSTYATSSPAAGVIGDRLSMSVVPASTPTVRNLAGGGIGFTPTVSGDFDFANRFAADANAVVRYIPIMSGDAVTLNSIEASSTMYADAMTITDMQVFLNTPISTGGGIQKQFAIRVNSATSTATCTIDQTGTKDRCRWSGTLSIAAGDKVNYVDLPTGGPGGSVGDISIVASVPAAAVVSSATNRFVMPPTGGRIIINGGKVVMNP